MYLISNQQRFGFVSAKVFLALGYKFSSVLIVTNPELQALPRATNISDSALAHRPGADIVSGGAVYWIGTDWARHAYSDIAVYNSWHLHNNFTTVLPASSADLALPVGNAVIARKVN